MCTAICGPHDAAQASHQNNLYEADRAGECVAAPWGIRAGLASCRVLISERVVLRVEGMTLVTSGWARSMSARERTLALKPRGGTFSS
jgi:hypothetical protein